MSDLSVPADGDVAIDSLFLNLSSRDSVDARYCRIRQDSATELKLLCGFDSVLTSAQKLTAQCNLEIDTTLEGTSPTTVDASQSSGFVPGTKGRPYFTMGPGTLGLITPKCFEHDTSGTKLLRGTGTWGTDDDGNTTVECTIGVRQVEATAAGRNARFAAACTKDGAGWAALPATGMAEFNTRAGGDEDVTELSANSGTCGSDRACVSGYCVTSGICIASGGIGKIVYYSQKALNGSNSAYNIWVMNIDGSGDTPLTNITANASSGNPRWSPDGTKIVFDSKMALDGSDAANTNNTYNVRVMNADGSGNIVLTNLTATDAGCANAQWSPDGSRIAYYSRRALDGSDSANTNLTWNLWVMNADGSENTALTRLTADNAESYETVWSPDGSRIAYGSQRALDGSDAANTNNTHNVWVMNADGSNHTALTAITTTEANGGSLRPRWSPDGNKILYHSSRALDGSNTSNNGTHNIWIMNADGSENIALTNITATDAHSVSYQWPSDGGRLFYMSRRALDGSDTANSNNTYNIWVMDADGSDDTPLTSITAAATDSWEPYSSP